MDVFNALRYYILVDVSNALVFYVHTYYRICQIHTRSLSFIGGCTKSTDVIDGYIQCPYVLLIGGCVKSILMLMDISNALAFYLLVIVPSARFTYWWMCQIHSCSLMDVLNLLMLLMDKSNVLAFYLIVDVSNSRFTKLIGGCVKYTHVYWWMC